MAEVACKALTKNGRPCQGRPLADGYCRFHSATTAEAQQEARRRGGQNKAKTVRLGRLVPPRLIPIFDTLEEAMNECYSGELEPRIAQALASLAGAMVKVIAAGEMEERLRKLEQVSQAREPLNRGRR